MTERERWERAIDRETTGEALDEGERAFVRAYERAHPECAEERVLWERALELLGDADPSLDELDVDELAQVRARALAIVRGEVDDQTSRAGEPGAVVAFTGSTGSTGSTGDAETSVDAPRPRRRWAAAAGLGLAAAAALALAWGLGAFEAPTKDATEVAQGDPTPAPDSDSDRPERPERPERPDPVSETAEVGLLSMSVDGADGSVEPGARLTLAPTARTCLVWSQPTAVVCAEGASFAIVPGRAAGERRVALDDGLAVAVLDPLGPGQRFVIETDAGSVQAVGTIFAVEVAASATRSLVLEGKVELSQPTGPASDEAAPDVLAADQQWTLGHGPAELVDPELRARAESLAGLGERWRRTDSLGDAILQIDDSSADDAGLARAVTVDGVDVGGLPLTLHLQPGTHVVRRGEIEQTLTVEAGAPTVIDLREPSSDAHASAPREVVPSASTLAARAQASRRARDYAETARLYRLLLEHHGDSREATNVPVRLGDVLMTMGEHKQALAAYVRYLDDHPKGALGAEAMLGQIRALRALGRIEEAGEAVERFHQRYPDDPRGAALEP